MNHYELLGVDRHASPDIIKAAYRVQAKKYHPDLTANDPRSQQQMQRVNEAYDKNNLLQLLELQLELEHIDQHSINRISEARLTHYNQILKDQVRELDRQIHRVETTFRYTYGYQQFEALPPDASGQPDAGRSRKAPVTCILPPALVCGTG